MAISTINNISTQVDIEKIAGQRVIVQLRDTSTDGRRQHSETKTGLIRISTIKNLQRGKKRLRRDFKHWIPPDSRISQIGNNEHQQSDISQEEFTDVAPCLEFIEQCGNKCVMVILSDNYLENKELLSTLKKLPQIVFIYRYLTEAAFENLRHHWCVESQSFARDVLPRSWIKTHIKDIDPDGQLLLVQLFLMDLVVNLPRSDNAKKDFIRFCHNKYRDDPAYATYAEKIEIFNKTYEEKDAIKWYSNPESFIFRIVGKTCASLDIDTLFKIRFILRDLYAQLQELYVEQLKDSLKKDITVYRGKMLSKNEFNRLKNKGQLFITRHFLSTSKEKGVGNMYSGDGVVTEDQVSVLISMKIERAEIQDKPIAFIKDHSHIRDENEVMLSMGFVFRADSYEEVHNNLQYPVKINMIRGEDEKQIEKNLSRFHLITQTGAACAALGMVPFLESTNNGQHVEQYSRLMSDALRSSDSELAEQFSNIAKSNAQSVSAAKEVTMEAPNNTINLSKDFVVNVPNDCVHESPLLNMEIEKGLNNVERTNLVEQLPIDGATNANHIDLITEVVVTSQTPHARLIFILATTLILTAAIVTPLALVLSAKTHPTPATVCPHIVCSIVTDVRNPSPNYQVEQLNLTCSQTLSNMSIIEIVQRSLNETNAQQYQTFWNESTNMTYIETPTQLIYYCYSLPGMLIVNESFPHFIEAQYYYTPGSVRNTSNDTWQIWLESICGETQYFFGTY